jgi:hypothetical protein
MLRQKYTSCVKEVLINNLGSYMNGARCSSAWSVLHERHLISRDLPTYLGSRPR